MNLISSYSQLCCVEGEEEQEQRECFTRNIVTCSTIHWLQWPWPFLRLPPAPISDDFVTGASRTLPPSTNLAFRWSFCGEEKRHLRKEEKRKALFIDRFFIECSYVQLLKITYDSQSGVSILAGVIPTEIAFCVVLSNHKSCHLLKMKSSSISLFTKTSPLILACNHKCYGFRLLGQPTYARRMPYCSRWESCWLPMCEAPATFRQRVKKNPVSKMSQPTDSVIIAWSCRSVEIKVSLILITMRSVTIQDDGLTWHAYAQDPPLDCFVTKVKEVEHLLSGGLLATCSGNHRQTRPR